MQWLERRWLMAGSECLSAAMLCFWTMQDLRCRSVWCRAYHMMHSSRGLLLRVCWQGTLRRLAAQLDKTHCV